MGVVGRYTGRVTHGWEGHCGVVGYNTGRVMVPMLTKHLIAHFIRLNYLSLLSVIIIFHARLALLTYHALQLCGITAHPPFC